jgi:Tfp pilus assembly protein PilO
MTNTVREYRMPLLIGGGTLVVALLLWVAFISPQNSKLSSLRAQQTQLQTQQTGLEAKLASLRSEQQKLSTSCADLQKISTQIPSVQNPTDIDAEESSFESQFNGLAASTGVTLTQFSGFTPATSATGTAVAATPSTGSTGSTGTVVPVPTNLQVTGTYGQVLAFVNGLDTFPRLFVIQKFVLSIGATAASTGANASASAAANAAPAIGSTPLWVGGTPTSPAAAPYSLSITGSIYYTATPSALAACTRATALVHKG